MQKQLRGFFLILICICLSFTYDASAQFNRNYKQKKRQYRTQNSRIARFTGRKYAFSNAREYVTLGFSVNALNYFGDIAPKSNIASTDISYTRPGLGISSSVRLGPSFSVRAAFLYGRVSSSDFEVASPQNEFAVKRYARNLHFRNNIKDFSIVGVLDLFPNPGSAMFRAGFTPYAFGGVSVFHHNPKAKVPEKAVLYASGDTLVLPEAGKWVALAPLHTEGIENAYSPFQISIPFGLGFRFRLNQIMDFEVETSYRYLFTDYLDDVSKNYADKGLLESDLAKVMSDRSLEPVDVLSGEERFKNVEDEFNRNVVRYTGADEKEYLLLNGYGEPNQIRGSPNDNDIFLTTSCRLIIVIGKSPFAKKIR